MTKKKAAAKKTASKKAEAPKGELRISYEPLSKLKKARRNPKLHDGHSIKKSIGRFGFNDPITINEKTGRMVTGHGRVDQLALMKDRGEEPPERVKVGEGGEWLVPVLRGVSFASEAEAEAYIVAHNQTSIAGGWDDRALAQVLVDISGTDHGVDGLGFAASAIESLTALLGDHSREEPDAPDSFKEYDDETIDVDHECPKCGYKF